LSEKSKFKLEKGNFEDSELNFFDASEQDDQDNDDYHNDDGDGYANAFLEKKKKS